MIKLLLIRIRFCIGFADTFGDDFGIALLVASVLAVCTLHSSSVFQELPTHGTAHEIVKLLSDEFMSISLVDLFFIFAVFSDSTFSSKTSNVVSFSLSDLFYCTMLVCPREKKRHLPKLRERCIWPTGSRANHASIVTGGAPGCIGAFA
jgi:hypothetical protein